MGSEINNLRYSLSWYHKDISLNVNSGCLTNHKLCFPKLGCVVRLEVSTHCVKLKTVANHSYDKLDLHSLPLKLGGHCHSPKMHANAIPVGPQRVEFVQMPLLSNHSPIDTTLWNQATYEFFWLRKVIYLLITIKQKRDFMRCCAFFLSKQHIGRMGSYPWKR